MFLPATRSWRTDKTSYRTCTFQNSYFHRVSTVILANSDTVQPVNIVQPFTSRRYRFRSSARGKLKCSAALRGAICSTLCHSLLIVREHSHQRKEFRSHRFSKQIKAAVTFVAILVISRATNATCAYRPLPYSVWR